MKVVLIYQGLVDKLTPFSFILGLKALLNEWVNIMNKFMGHGPTKVIHLTLQLLYVLLAGISRAINGGLSHKVHDF